jgi:hypothetical protein
MLESGTAKSSIMLTPAQGSRARQSISEATTDEGSQSHNGKNGTIGQQINIACRQRLLGAFYTPDGLAEMVVRWALQPGPGKILDPSYDGCAFLRAGAHVLKEQGVSRQGTRRQSSTSFGVRR